MKIFHAIVIAMLLVTALSVQAQWQWVDSNGKKVFSDRPPSPEVPEKNIVKRPLGAAFNTPASTVDKPAPAASMPTSLIAPVAAKVPARLPRPSGKDTELEKKKAEIDAAEMAKKKADEQKVAAAKSDNCERARRALESLQSGVRIAQINAQGEREFMSDDARQAELTRAENTIASECRP